MGMKATVNVDLPEKYNLTDISNGIVLSEKVQFLLVSERENNGLTWW